MKNVSIFKTVKIREVIFSYIFAVLICIIASVIAVKYFNIPLNDSLINYLVFGVEIITLIIILYKLNIKYDSVSTLLKSGIKNTDIKDVVKSVILYFILCIGGSFLIIYFIYIFNSSAALFLITQIPIVVNTKLDYIVNIIYMTIIIPINEELIFRHIIFKRISEKTSAYCAVIVIALVFASINVGAGVIGAFAISVINSTIYAKYKNILVPILNRILINIIAITLILPIVKYYRHGNMLREIVVKRNAVIGLFLLALGTIMFIKFILDNKIYLHNLKFEYKNL